MEFQVYPPLFSVPMTSYTEIAECITFDSKFRVAADQVWRRRSVYSGAETPINWEIALPPYIGCYSIYDLSYGSPDELKPALALSSPTMTPQKCNQICNYFLYNDSFVPVKYPYFHLRNSTDCVCSFTLPVYSGYCGTPCSGDKYSLCGDASGKGVSTYMTETRNFGCTQSSFTSNNNYCIFPSPGEKETDPSITSCVYNCLTTDGNYLRCYDAKCNNYAQALPCAKYCPRIDDCTSSSCSGGVCTYSYNYQNSRCVPSVQDNQNSFGNNYNENNGVLFVSPLYSSTNYITSSYYCNWGIFPSNINTMTLVATVFPPESMITSMSISKYSATGNLVETYQLQSGYFTNGFQSYNFSSFFTNGLILGFNSGDNLYINIALSSLFRSISITFTSVPAVQICDISSSCEQLCKSVGDGPVCLCYPGYVMNNSKCVKYVPPLLDGAGIVVDSGDVCNSEKQTTYSVSAFGYKCKADTRGDGVFRSDCSFPFIYEGTIYSTCITLERNRPWCPLKYTSTTSGSTYIDATGNNEWGYCSCNAEFDEYSGCYDAYQNNYLNQQMDTMLVSETMTTELCSVYCKEKNYVYYGVINRTQCFCSKVLPDSGSLLRKTYNNCSLGCGGDPGYICGGTLAASMYKILDFGLKDRNVSLYYHGCYPSYSFESNSYVIGSFYSPNLTPALCAYQCQTQNIPYRTSIDYITISGDLCSCLISSKFGTSQPFAAVKLFSSQSLSNYCFRCKTNNNTFCGGEHGEIRFSSVYSLSFAPTKSCISRLNTLYYQSSLSSNGINFNQPIDINQNVQLSFFVRIGPFDPTNSDGFAVALLTDDSYYSFGTSVKFDMYSGSDESSRNFPSRYVCFKDINITEQRNNYGGTTSTASAAGGSYGYLYFSDCTNPVDITQTQIGDGYPHLIVVRKELSKLYVSVDNNLLLVNESLTFGPLTSNFKLSIFVGNSPVYYDMPWVSLQASCPNGYVYNAVTGQCDDFDECPTEGLVCDYCRNLPGSWMCDCPTGYLLVREQQCEDLNECVDFEGICSPAYCNNTNGSYYCSCGVNAFYQDKRCNCPPTGFIFEPSDQSCIDIDECYQDTHNCGASRCVNTVGSFNCTCGVGARIVDVGTSKSCVCDSGYHLNSSYDCEDINECLDAPCSHTCTNVAGSFKCSCPNDYGYNLTNNRCIDINECTDCKTCDKCEQVCVNYDGWYRCDCWGGYRLISNKSCTEKDCFMTEWSDWIIDVGAKTRKRRRYVDLAKSDGSPLCYREPRTQTFTISEETKAENAIVIIHNIFSDHSGNGGQQWVQDIFDGLGALFPFCMGQISTSGNVIKIPLTPKSNWTEKCATVSKKRSLCEISYTNVTEIFADTVTDFLPSISRDRIYVNLDEADCSMALSIERTIDDVTIASAATVGIIVLLAIIFAVVFYRMKRSSRLARLSDLPDEVAWQWLQYQKNPSSWKQESQNMFTKQLKKGSEEWKRMISIFEQLNGEKLNVKEACAVYNNNLLSNFINRIDLIENRYEQSSEVFFKQGWKGKNDSKDREWIYSEYEKRVKEFDWNKKTETAILPTIHGTDKDIALKIADTGFAALSTLDAGWYGKGIYFTTYALYAIPYFGTKRNPSIIISYVIPGNTYPVSENHKSADSLSGAAMMGGYSSHYVCTTKDGYPTSKPVKNHYDEIVIEQEVQIAPVYILTIDTSNIPNLLKEFQREIPENRTEADFLRNNKNDEDDEEDVDGSNNSQGDIEMQNIQCQE
eukprot:TRINITY_DN4359_c0_g2_i3.p1 TRINITY_DN4359_c0_g2~~TRINITY_DN4359_c0_g2_i3.p1  ORF type:complete len:1736 (-),score=241.48 TRINITY_DN4359_c0_g2_i3:164-5371(-)